MVKRICELILLAVVAFCRTVLGAEEPVTLERNGDRIDVLIGGHAFTSFHFGAAIAKPYLFGCGYFLATIKPAKNQVILSNGAAAMTGNSWVIEESEGYPRV